MNKSASKALKSICSQWIISFLLERFVTLLRQLFFFFQNVKVNLSPWVYIHKFHRSELIKFCYKIYPRMKAQVWDQLCGTIHASEPLLRTPISSWDQFLLSFLWLSPSFLLRAQPLHHEWETIWTLWLWNLT